MLLRTAAALASLSCAAPLSAQQNIVYHDDNVATAGSSNAFPFGSIGVRTQQRIPGSVLGGPALIQDLFVAPALGVHSVSEVVYSDIEIRMGANSAGTLTTSWASNIPSPTVVYRGPLRVTFTRDQWSPLGLPNAYAWVPASSADDLVIDVILWGASSTGAIPPSAGSFLYVRVSTGHVIQRAYLRDWTTAQPANAAFVDTDGVKVGLLLGSGNFVPHGNACLGRNGWSPAIGTQPGIWPTLGGQLAVTLANGPASSVAVLYVGASDRTWLGIPLPFDMAPLGAARCMVWHDPEVLLGSAGIDALGAASLAFPIPSQANLLARRFYVSWFTLDPPANSLHVTTSGYATVIVGS